jgi:hypothetical protein
MLCKLVVSRLPVSKDASTELEESPLIEAATSEDITQWEHLQCATSGSSEGSQSRQSDSEPRIIVLEMASNNLAVSHYVL